MFEKGDVVRAKYSFTSKNFGGVSIFAGNEFIVSRKVITMGMVSGFSKKYELVDGSFSFHMDEKRAHKYLKKVGAGDV